METSLTDARKDIFLQALAEHGVISRAAEVAGVTDRTAYYWRKKDPAFIEYWDYALAKYADKLEEEAHRRAVAGVPEPVVYKGRLAYREEPVTNPDGTLALGEDGQPIMRQTATPLTVTKYSDALLVKLLEANNRKYQQARKVELTGADGGPIQVEHSPLETARKIAFALQQGLMRAPETVDAELAPDDGFSDLV